MMMVSRETVTTSSEIPIELVIRGNSLYTIVDGPSWTEAEANSTKLGGHLVKINNKEEDQFLSNSLTPEKFTLNDWREYDYLITRDDSGELIRPVDQSPDNSYTEKLTIGDPYWIGLYGFHSLYKYPDGSVSQYIGEISPFNTFQGNPHTLNIRPFVEHYYMKIGSDHSDNGYWATTSFTDGPSGGVSYLYDKKATHGIVETPFIRRGDSAYVIVEGPTWEEAEANANKLGGHLVTINDANENNFLYGFKEENELGKWIGLTDKNNEGQWEWSSGEVSSFNAWDLNQPDDHVDPHNPNGQDFVSFDWDKGSLSEWDDKSDHAVWNLKGIAEIKLDPNNAPSGSPAISGSLETRETLTADISSINDADNFQGWTPPIHIHGKSSTDKNNWTEIGNGSTYVITSAEEGKYLKLDVSYLDGYGTVENLSSSISGLILDTTPPSQPIITTTTTLTNNSTPTIEGTAEEGSTVELFNGKILSGKATAGSDGSFSITSSQLADNTYSLTVTATDAAGNISASSDTLSITVDTIEPTITITSNISSLKVGESATLTFTFLNHQQTLWRMM